ncbi:hypothetical protein DPMN_150941 [Dreissena polymorpha]|uniref:Uncharacterized protein n=1 Tax=Dreissena polymorpha TaxID=45954 RepID=A0A9D4J2I3_DREPO|nr:hypothetical protein DPMN_150941 [Dreissena polymorpha]
MKLCASSFFLPNQFQEEISNLGKGLMVELFGGKSNDSSESLRHNIFTKKVTSAETFVTPERLPPKSHTTICHSQRVLYRIMVWMGMAKNTSKCARSGR